MADFEKYIPRRINKDVSPETLKSGDRGFLPGDLKDALNVRYFNNGADGVAKNIKGNVLKAYPELPPIGRNKVIGTCLNKRDNTIIYFIWNQLQEHRVVEFSLDNQTFVTLLAGSSLPFDETKYIHGGTIDDLLLWNDANYPICCISLSRARALGYIAPYTKAMLTLAVKPPMIPAIVTVETISGLLINRLAGETWQVTYRWVFKDDRKSAFAPLSTIAYIRAHIDPSDLNRNALLVTLNVPADIKPMIKAVDLATRQGNVGIYKIFKSIRTITDTITAYFTNTETQEIVPTVEQSKIFDTIPERSECFELIDNRVFCPLNVTGFDYKDEDLELTLSLWDYNFGILHSVMSYPYIGTTTERFMKVGGAYNVGVVLYDEYGRPTFVKGRKQITIPYEFAHPTIPNVIKRHHIRWALSAVNPIPSQFKYYSIVISENQNQDVYFQCKAVFHWYERDLKIGETDGNQYAEWYFWRGKKFQEFSNPRIGAGFPTDLMKLVYIQLPLNVPFLPDVNCFIRFDPGEGLPVTVCEIDAVVGDFILVRLSEEQVLYMSNNSKHILDIEVYTVKEVDEIFYETGPVYPIVDNNFSVLNGELDGDTYQMVVSEPTDHLVSKSADAHVYSSMSIEGDAVNEPAQKNWVNYPRAWMAESPTGIIKSIFMQRPVDARAKFGGKTFREETTSSETVKSLDYTRESWNIGRIHVTNADSRLLDLYTTFGFSDVYIQQSFVNGLNSFTPANQYPLAIERGRVRSAKRAGSILLAIHERETSTLYIGEGFIRQGKDFILAKTEGVVGDDRKLAGSWGTINPESVKEINDNVYFWDAYKGAVVRYTNSGLYPVSLNGMENYFFEKGQQLFPYRDKVKVVTGFDQKFKEFIISFGDVLTEEGIVLIPGETWAFNVKDETWKARYSFVPDVMESMSMIFLSFKDGGCWLHNANEVCNNFYGIQYGRSMKYVCNPFLGKNKRYLNIHIKGPLCTDPTSEFQVVKFNTSEGQESFTPAYEFELDNGKMVAPILKDVNSFVETIDQLPLRSGDDLISNYLEFEIFNDRTDEAACPQVNIVYKTEDHSI